MRTVSLLVLILLVSVGLVESAVAKASRPRAGSLVRADIDGDRYRETVRVVRLRGSWLRVEVRDRRAGRRVRKAISPRVRRMNALQVQDVTGDGQRDTWLVATLTRRAPRRMIARIVDWSGSRAVRLFAYDSKRSKLGRRWAGSRVALTDVAGGNPVAREVRVTERKRLGRGRYTNVVTWYKLVGRRYVAFQPAPGSAGTAPSANGPQGPLSGHHEGLTAPPEPPNVPPSVFIRPDGNDGAPCSQAAPCQSFDRAYHVAAPGQVIQVAGGTYGVQTLTPDGSKPAGSPVVVFRPAPGEAVRTGELRCGASSSSFGADRVEIADITVSDVTVARCDALTLRRVTVDGGVWVDSSTNFSMVGGSVGPGTNVHPDVQAVNGIVPRNVLFEGVYFHDWIRTNQDAHVECLQVSDVIGFTLRNSSFHNCDIFDVHADGTTAGPLQDVVIENNVFEPSGDHATSGPSYYSLSVRDGDYVVIRNNASSQSFVLPSSGDSVSRWVVANNVAPLSGLACDDRIVFSHNLWSSAKCGPTDRSGPLGFVNAGAFDYRPAPGSLAIDNGDPANATPYDMRGRPRDARPDIGPYEGA